MHVFFLFKINKALFSYSLGYRCRHGKNALNLLTHKALAPPYCFKHLMVFFNIDHSKLSPHSFTVRDLFHLSFWKQLNLLQWMFGKECFCVNS